MSDHFSFHALSHGDTEKLGAALAQTVTAGTIVGLVGTLGSGKTKLVQSIAIARGVDPQSVVSPTYVILHEYPGPITIFHFDLYRVADLCNDNGHSDHNIEKENGTDTFYF